MADIKAGDEVRVLRTRRGYGLTPPEGGYRATVTRTGRRYATAVFDEALAAGQGTREWEISFDMETGIVRADTDGWYVRTPDELDREERRKMAMFLLGERGIEVKLGYANSLTLDQIEALAEVVKTWNQED